MRENGDMFWLGQVRWQFFGSLTFKQEHLTDAIRLKMFFALMRRAATKFEKDFRFLPWLLRLERGEIGGRKHFHFLLTGLPGHVVNRSSCFYLMAHWKRVGGGWARVKVFDSLLGGESYILKSAGGVVNGGDLYESAKFGVGSCELMRSGGLQRVLQSLSMRTDGAPNTAKTSG